MMSILENLALGLRGAAGVLNPQIQKMTFEQDNQREQLMERRRDIAAQQLIKGAETGAIEPEAAKTMLERLGYGNIPVGMTPEASLKVLQLRNELANGSRPQLIPPGTTHFLQNGAVREIPGAAPKQTNAAMRQRELEAQGYPPNVARGIAYGEIKVVPTSNGGVQIVNTAQALAQGTTQEQQPENLRANIQGDPRQVFAEIATIKDPRDRELATQAYRLQLAQQMRSGGQPNGIQPDRVLPGSIGGINSNPNTKERQQDSKGKLWWADSRTGELTPMIDPTTGNQMEGSGAAKIELLGARESAQLNRVLAATNQAMKDLRNIIELPISASRGIFGGRVQGKSLFEAGKESLANTMTTQEVQSYNVFATGIQRALAQIESMGLATTNSLVHQMDAVIIKEGDTNTTKLQKLAQIRQIVESGLETVLTNPRLSKEQSDHAKSIIKEVQKAVPFTGAEVLRLNKIQLSNPSATMKDVMKEAEKNKKLFEEADAIIKGGRGGQ